MAAVPPGQPASRPADSPDDAVKWLVHHGDEQEPLLLVDLPADGIHAIARQLVSVGACNVTHEGTIQHMSNIELMPASDARDGWASALTSLRAVKHMTMLCTGLRSTLLGDELLWSMLRRRRSDVLTASAPLASLPRLTPDARVCSAHIVPHGTPAVLSMPLSDAVEIETWQAIEEQARHGHRRARSNARTHARARILPLASPPTHNPPTPRCARGCSGTSHRPRASSGWFTPPRAARRRTR